MKMNKPTFSKMLKRIEQKNAERLMTKARLANRIAKKSRGTNRKTAYYVKSKALSSLVKNLSKQVRVFRDIKLTGFVVVELRKEQSGLHLPFARLAE